jgi:hypothetical protein
VVLAALFNHSYLPGNLQFFVKAVCLREELFNRRRRYMNPEPM